MRAVICGSLVLAMAGIILAAGQDTKPAQAVSDAFIKAIVNNDFQAYRTFVSTKLLDEFAKNPKNCKIQRWWDSARAELEKHQAKWEYKGVKTNMPKIIDLEYKRTMDSGESVVMIELVKEGEKWLVDSAGSL
jgi:hypothetical protein